MQIASTVSSYRQADRHKQSLLNQPKVVNLSLKSTPLHSQRVGVPPALQALGAVVNLLAPTLQLGWTLGEYERKLTAADLALKKAVEYGGIPEIDELKDARNKYRDFLTANTDKMRMRYAEIMETLVDAQIDNSNPRVVNKAKDMINKVASDNAAFQTPSFSTQADRVRSVMMKEVIPTDPYYPDPSLEHGVQSGWILHGVNPSVIHAPRTTDEVMNNSTYYSNTPKSITNIAYPPVISGLLKTIPKHQRAPYKETAFRAYKPLFKSRMNEFSKHVRDQGLSIPRNLEYEVNSKSFPPLN